MSKYTTELRYICMSESGFDFSDPLTEHHIDDIIKAARRKIFIYPYEIFDETFREDFECGILFHFYREEIGQETVGDFKYHLGKKLREIMPEMNKLYKLALLEYNPLHDVDYYKTHEGTAEGLKDREENAETVSNYAGRVTTSSENVTDGNVQTNANGQTDRTGERDKTTNESTATESDTTTNTQNDGTTHGESVTDTDTVKDVQNTYQETNVRRDAYSDTPQTSILGVEGDGSGDPEHNVSDNYYLTNYRKITDAKNGQNTGHETGFTNTEGTTDGTSHDEGRSVTHSEGTGTRDVVEDENNTETTVTENNETTDNHTESVTDGEETSENTTESESSSAGRESYSNADEYNEHVSGKIGSASYSQMIMEAYDAVLNVNAIVYQKLEPLFMGIY